MAKTESERLVETYADVILRVAYTYLGSTEDAEDICQEVLIKLLRREMPFESNEHERAWVVHVTANQCKDLLRARKSHLMLMLDEAREVIAPRARSEAEELGRSQSVLSAVMSLPLLYREAIYLHYYEGYSIARIAESCGCTEAAAAARLSRGRARMRTMLGGDYDEQVI